MSNRVALIGAGIMGSAIGTRLLETGNQLAVLDVDKDKIAAVVAKGNAIGSGCQVDATRMPGQQRDSAGAHCQTCSV